ncbi:hypothetical protein B0H67DRAFT_372941 [Lasiosphaeris hirsuta]|uniref:F-box domain-containing protein n=1 Tax=Lasiosphaeris hirsuta TaxID=260670 RepID=A0AA39ZWY1_9PEZI|nr:hypothetical protein B0H67DRAFT_372941 [Lasiosphaeris hirsuta]
MHGKHTSNSGSRHIFWRGSRVNKSLSYLEGHTHRVMEDKQNNSPMAALGPEIGPRRAFLRSLVASLTQHDARYLAEQLSKLDFRTDIVARLPVDLRVLVADHVDREDAISMLNVSKTWRQIWLQEDAFKRLADRCLPSFLPYNRLKDHNTATDEGLKQLFREASRKLRIRLKGKFRSVMFTDLLLGPADNAQRFSLDRDYHHAIEPDLNRFLESLAVANPASLSPYYESLYSNGRLAWLPPLPQHPKARVIIDDFKTQLRRVYSIDMNIMLGGSAQLLALGNKLVILVSDAGRTLHAWDLETNEHDTVQTPSHVQRVQTDGNQACVFFNFPDAALWTFQGGLKALDMAWPLENLEKSNEFTSLSQVQHSAIFHPLLVDTVFIVFYLESHELLVLYEYNLGHYTTFHSAHLPKLDHHGCQTPSRSREFQIRRIGPYGDYGLVQSAVWCRHKRGCSLTKVAGARGEIVALTSFNVVDAKFSTHLSRIPEIHPKREERQVYSEPAWWDGQATSWTHPQCLAAENIASFQFPVRISNELGGAHKRSGSKIPYRGSDPSREITPGNSISKVEEELSDGTYFRHPEVECYLDLSLGDKYFGREGQRINSLYTQSIWSDEDYIVLRHNGSLAIWSFYTDMLNRPPLKQDCTCSPPLTDLPHNCIEAVAALTLLS